MNKFWIFIIAVMLLVACSDNEAQNDNSQQSKTAKETEQTEKVAVKPGELPTSTKGLSEEELKQVAINLANMVASTATLTFYYETMEYSRITLTPDTYRQLWRELLSPLVSEEVLQQHVLDGISNDDLCYGCDFGIYSVEMNYQADIKSIELINDNVFEVTQFVPANEVFNPREVLYQFTYDDVWKLTALTISNVDHYEAQATTNSPELLDLQAQVTTLRERHYEYLYGEDLGSQADRSNHAFQLLEEMQAVETKFEEMILSIDSMYPAEQKVWKDNYDRAVKGIEQLTMGGSGQGLYMLEKELQLTEARLIELSNRVDGSF